MKLLKFNLKLLVLCFISITFLLSCENDTTDIGANLIPDKSAGNIAYVDLVAYNVSNNDTIRADYKTLTKGLIGVYEDNIFGKSKASFSTQLRLSTSDEIKGSMQIVDSVVLSLFPEYNSSQSKVKQITLNPGTTSGIDTIKYITRYPITSFLGKTGSTMQLSVNKINTFLESIESKFYSNETVSVGELLGTKTIGDSVISTSIRTSNGSTIMEATTPGYYIKLDPTYFKQNFFDKKGSVNIADNSHFIQYFRGIRISPINEYSQFMFNFPVNKIKLIAYYRYKVNSSDSKYTNASYSFTMGGNYNTSLGEYNFYKRATASNEFLHNRDNPDKISGESKLFLQGMGGPSIHIKLNDSQLLAVKDSVQNKGWAIIGAKLKFYMTENFASKPNYIYAYNVTQKKFLPDLTNGYGSSYILNPIYDIIGNPGYYTLNITKQIKDIIEKNLPNDEILVEMGDFLKNSSNAYLGYTKTTRAYEPFRLVFYGNKTAGDKQLRLEIAYTKN